MALLVLAAAVAATAQDAPAREASSAGRCAGVTLQESDTFRTTLHGSLANAPRGRHERTYLEGVLREIAARVTPPGVLSLRRPEYGRYIPDRRSPVTITDGDTLGLATVIGFRLHRDGSISAPELLDSSEVPGIERALLEAIARADSARVWGPIPSAVRSNALAVRIRATPTVPKRGTAVPLFPVSVAYARLDKPVWTQPYNPPPEYPGGARRRDIGDDVELEFVIDEHGLADLASVRPVRFWSHVFLEAVLAVLPRHRFRPAEYRGCPVKQLVRHRFTFRIY